MRIAYIEKKFKPLSLEIIEKANAIIEDYEEQGYNLTLRQLYYQFVSRDWFPEQWADKNTGSTNNTQSYNKLGSLISDARLAGLMSWEAIVDRTRNVQSLSHWNDPAEIIDSAIHSFRLDKWKNQPYRPQVWIEKEALIGVISGVCNKLDVPYFACKGYVSQSEMWRAGHFSRQGIVIIHLGDHDPSGIDMTRDIIERLEMFSDNAVIVKRLALNMNQVDEYDPPPNPAKVTDSRYDGYRDEYGDESWELDALEPSVISALIEEAVLDLRDEEIYEDCVAREEAYIEELEEIKRRWE